jgi:hypothetical protein
MVALPERDRSWRDSRFSRHSPRAIHCGRRRAHANASPNEATWRASGYFPGASLHLKHRWSLNLSKLAQSSAGSERRKSAQKAIQHTGRRCVRHPAVDSALGADSIVEWVPAVSTMDRARACLRQIDSRDGRLGSRPTGLNSVSSPG